MARQDDRAWQVVACRSCRYAKFVIEAATLADGRTILRVRCANCRAEMVGTER